MMIQTDELERFDFRRPVVARPSRAAASPIRRKNVEYYNVFVLSIRALLRVHSIASVHTRAYMTHESHPRPALLLGAPPSLRRLPRA